MSCICNPCNGTGTIREVIDGGRKTRSGPCWYCNGTGGWDEGDSKPSPGAVALTEAAARRAAK